MTGRAKAFFDDLTTQAAWMRRLVLILPVAGFVVAGLCQQQGGCGSQAVDAGYGDALPRIVISEFRTNGTGGEEFIEIFNAGDVAVDIGGWLIREFGSVPGVEVSYHSSSRHHSITRSALSYCVPTRHINRYSRWHIIRLALLTMVVLRLIMPFLQQEPHYNIVIDAVGMSSGIGI